MNSMIGRDHEPGSSRLSGPASWVLFENERRTKSRLTCIWDVNTRDGTPLGEVRWFTSWRRYVFIPRSGSLYEQDCLRVLAEFCERQTNLNKQFARNRREIREREPGRANG